METTPAPLVFSLSRQQEYVNLFPLLTPAHLLDREYYVYRAKSDAKVTHTKRLAALPITLTGGLEYDPINRS